MSQLPQIHARVKKLTRNGSISSYCQAIDYLLEIISSILQQENSLEPKQVMVSRISRSQSQKGFSPQVFDDDVNASGQVQEAESFCKKLEQVVLNEKYDHHEKEDQKFLEGNGSSFLDKVFEMKWPAQKKAKPGQKINGRELQTSIEVYHQCLGKTLSLMGDLCDCLPFQVRMQSLTRERPEDKLQKFWRNYSERKQKCQTFQDLSSLVNDHLASQFLSNLYLLKEYLPKKAKLINLAKCKFKLHAIDPAEGAPV